jgi:NADP-dependent 3-hydroxy acid dehydrogenase YdfG
MPLLQNRIAIITGATAGIGEAIARDFLAHDCVCVLNARRREKLDALVQEFGQEDAVAVAGDCADDAVIAGMLDAAANTLGPTGRGADIIVVNAGRGLSGSVLTSDDKQWEEMIRTNILAAAKLIRHAAQRMLAEMKLELGVKADSAGPHVLSRPRDIVVLGSTVGRHISPFSSMYGATKFAVNSMAEAVRRELGPKGIRVSLVEPGFVESEFQGVAGYEAKWFDEVKGRIGPVLQPVDIARLVTFIVSQPPHVHLSDSLIRPTRQEYP